MDKITINVSNLTIHYYILKKNKCNRNFFHRDFNVSNNKHIFCNFINIIYSTFLKSVLLCVAYYVDIFEKKNWCEYLIYVSVHSNFDISLLGVMGHNVAVSTYHNVTMHTDLFIYFIIYSYWNIIQYILYKNRDEFKRGNKDAPGIRLWMFYRDWVEHIA